MRVMGIQALVPRPGTSKAAPRQKIYPYLLRGLKDCRAEPRVGGRRDLHPDGMRLPLSGGDHRLGQPGGSGVAAVDTTRGELLRGGAGGGAVQFGKPRIFNTDQGSTFTAEAFTSKLVTARVEISMDGRGRFMDNIFIERLWR